MFNNFLGNEPLKEYFSNAIHHNQLSHSYIFEGPKGVGKKTFATILTKLLTCSLRDDEPCNECNSCHMINSNAHPDVLTILKSGKLSTKIDDVRKGIAEMNIKPFQASYKFLIVAEADTLTVEAQNALLKTIEEPPSYGVCILICENISKLLPTIISRCIKINFSPLPNKDISQYLIQNGADKQKATIYSMLAEGSMGKAKSSLDNEDFMAFRDKSVKLITKVQGCDITTLYEAINEANEYKESLLEMVNFWTLWFRDISLIKTTNEPTLFFPDYKEQLLIQAENLSLKKLGTILESSKSAIADLSRNITTTFILESLFLTING